MFLRFRYCLHATGMCSEPRDPLVILLIKARVHLAGSADVFVCRPSPYRPLVITRAVKVTDREARNF
jgi:hypothetical protein